MEENGRAARAGGIGVQEEVVPLDGLEICGKIGDFFGKSKNFREE